MKPGRVVAISVSTRKGVPKTNVPSASLRAGWGIEGDAHAGQWHRQVSLLAVEAVERMRAKGADVAPGSFAENITTADVDLGSLSVGDRLHIGETVELEITQIGKVCHQRCAIFDAVGDCVMPREGLFAVVRHGGPVRTGDRVEPISGPPATAAE